MAFPNQYAAEFLLIQFLSSVHLGLGIFVRKRVLAQPSVSNSETARLSLEKAVRLRHAGVRHVRSAAEIDEGPALVRRRLASIRDLATTSGMKTFAEFKSA